MLAEFFFFLIWIWPTMESCFDYMSPYPVWICPPPPFCRFLYVSLASVCFAESGFVQISRWREPWGYILKATYLNIKIRKIKTKKRFEGPWRPRKKTLRTLIQIMRFASHQGEASVAWNYIFLHRRYTKLKILVAEHCFIFWRQVGAVIIIRRRISQYACGRFFSLLHIITSP